MWPSLDGSPGMVSTTELQNTAMDGRAGVLDVIHCKVAMFSLKGLNSSFECWGCNTLQD